MAALATLEASADFCVRGPSRQQGLRNRHLDMGNKVGDPGGRSGTWRKSRIPREQNSTRDMRDRRHERNTHGAASASVLDGRPSDAHGVTGALDRDRAEKTAGRLLQVADVEYLRERPMEAHASAAHGRRHDVQPEHRRNLPDETTSGSVSRRGRYNVGEPTASAYLLRQWERKYIH